MTNDEILGTHNPSNDDVYYQQVIVDKYLNYKVVMTRIPREEAVALAGPKTAFEIALEMQKLQEQAYQERMAMLSQGGTDPTGQEEWAATMHALGR